MMSRQEKLDLGMQVVIHSVSIHLLCEENMWPGLLQRGQGNTTYSELSISLLCLFDFLTGDYQFLADMIFMPQFLFWCLETRRC